MKRFRGFNLVGALAACSAVGALAIGFSLNAAPKGVRETGKSANDAVREFSTRALDSSSVDQLVLDSGIAKPGIEEGNAKLEIPDVEHLSIDVAFSKLPSSDQVLNGGEGGVAGVGTCPNAGGFPGSGQITQNTDLTNSGGTVACATMAGNTTRQGWARCYDQATEGVVPGGAPLRINEVRFFAGTVVTPPPGGINVHVNIYTLSGAGCPAPGGSILLSAATLLSSVNVNITAADAGMLKSAVFTGGVAIPDGVDFLVEIEQVDDGTSAVPTFGFRPGENLDTSPPVTDGQCGPSYIRGIAGACGITNWTDLAIVGTPGTFADDHLIQILIANESGSLATCGNGVVEGGEDCDPPGPTCSPNCQSPGPGIGACCNGLVCSVQLSKQCLSPSVYVGDGTDCTGSPCSVGACCTNNGQTCTPNVSLASCNMMGGTLLPAAGCTPNCCTAAATGADDCSGAAAIVPPLGAGQTRVKSGNNSGATGPDSCTALGGSCSVTDTTACTMDSDCPTGETCILDPLWWERIDTTGCTNLTLDFCCTSPTFSPVYLSLRIGCPCGPNSVAPSSFGFGASGPAPCADGNYSARWLDLPAGTYYYPIYSNFDGTLGNYQIHLSAAACAVGRCCNAGVCTPNVDETTCVNGGGFWGGAGSVCFPPGVCSQGACCVNEVCTDSVSQALCNSQNGDLFPGQSCANVTCPPINDDCADAIVVDNGLLIVDTVGARTDGPANGCGNASQVHDDVWYRYNATCTGDLTVSACPTTTNFYDMVIAVYNQAACNMLGAPLGCDDDGCGVGAGPSTVTVPVVAGQSYLIRVGGFAAGNEGTAVVDIGVTPSGGACCNPSGGTCTNVDGPANCLSPNQYHGGICCKDLSCAAADSCDWNNGQAEIGGGLASQYAPKEFYAEAADNFILKGSPSNDCDITEIKFWVRHFNQAAAGCTAGLCRCPNGSIFVSPGPTTCPAPGGTCDPITEGVCSGDCSFCFTEDAMACVGGNCVGGANGGLACTVPADCPGGVCVDKGNCVARTCSNTPDDWCGINMVVYRDATTAGGATKDHNFDVVPDLAIPDCNGTTPVPAPVSDVRVVNDPGTFIDLDVDIQITHTWVGDLVVDLSHNDGMTTVTQRLIQRVGDGGANDANPLCNTPLATVFGSSTADIDVILDDEDANSVELGPFPLNGRYRPSPGVLSAFDGRSKSGTWTLTVQDGFPGDTGTLNGWSLHFDNTPPQNVPKGPAGFPNEDGTHGRLCIGGNNAGLPCSTPADCPGGICPTPKLDLKIGTVSNPGPGVSWNWAPYVKDGNPVNNAFEVTVTFNPPISLDKNQKDWLAIAPVLPFTGFYQTAWAASQFFEGNPAQQIFEALGLTDWTKTSTDLAFRIDGITKVTGFPCTNVLDCRFDPADNACNHATCTGTCQYTCVRYGDVAPFPGGNNIVNLDDILCILAGFANPASCPNADISPCGGNAIINLDDILADLGAFAGSNTCNCTVNTMPPGVAPLCGSNQP